MEFITQFIGALAVVVFGFMLNRVFNKLDALERESCTRAELNAACEATREEMKALESIVSRKDHCEMVKRVFEDKFAVVHKRIDCAHTDNKESHQRLEKMMEGMSESLEKIATCVTKLSAKVHC